MAVTLSLLVCTRSLLGKRNDQVVDTIIADAGWDVLSCSRPRPVLWEMPVSVELARICLTCCWWKRPQLGHLVTGVETLVVSEVEEQEDVVKADPRDDPGDEFYVQVGICGSGRPSGSAHYGIPRSIGSP